MRSFFFAKITCLLIDQKSIKGGFNYMYGMEIYVIGFLAIFTIGAIIRGIFVDEP